MSREKSNDQSESKPGGGILKHLLVNPPKTSAEENEVIHSFEELNLGPLDSKGDVGDGDNDEIRSRGPTGPRNMMPQIHYPPPVGSTVVTSGLYTYHQHTVPSYGYPPPPYVQVQNVRSDLPQDNFAGSDLEKDQDLSVDKMSLPSAHGSLGSMPRYEPKQEYQFRPCSQAPSVSQESQWQQQSPYWQPTPTRVSYPYLEQPTLNPGLNTVYQLPVEPSPDRPEIPYPYETQLHPFNQSAPSQTSAWNVPTQSDPRQSEQTSSKMVKMDHDAYPPGNQINQTKTAPVSSMPESISQRANSQTNIHTIQHVPTPTMFKREPVATEISSDVVMSPAPVSEPSSTQADNAVEIDENGENCLHWISGTHDYALIQSVIEQMKYILGDKMEKYVNWNNRKGQTPLFLAVEQNNAHVVMSLLQNKADANIQGTIVIERDLYAYRSPLHIAAMKGDESVQVLLLLLQSPTTDVNLKSLSDKATALHLALTTHRETRNCRQTILLLLNNGADIHIQEEGSSKTPIMLAIESRDFDLVKQILNNLDADTCRSVLLEQTRSGDTCLHVAAGLSCVESAHKISLLRFLVTKGADSNVPNNVKELPRDLAPLEWRLIRQF